MQPDITPPRPAGWPNARQIGLITLLTRAQKSTHDAVVDVLIHGKPVTQCAREHKLSQPQLSKAVGRYVSVHQLILAVYGQKPHAMGTTGPTNPLKESP